MDSSQIAITKGADVFVFDYSHLDVAYSVTLGAGDWGLYQADGTVVVGQTLAPQIGTDEVTSLGGSFRTSISTAHLTSYTTARVHYDGQGFTLEYTLDNGATWHTLTEDGVITLIANADLDLRVTFPGNIANDPAVVNSLTVYILATETMNSLYASRVMTLTNSKITSDGLVVGTLSPSVAKASIVSTAPTGTTASVSEDFNQPLDPAVWELLGGAYVSDGTLTANENWVWSDSAQTVNSYDFTSSYLYVQITDPVAYQSDSFVNITTASGSTISWDIYHSDIQAGWFVPGDPGETVIYEAPYVPANHKWFRIREAYGYIYWDVSADGRVWTQCGSCAAPFDVTSVKIVMGAGDDDNSTLAAKFDNVNVTPALVGTIEMWVTPTTNSVLVSPLPGTVYTNGVAGAPVAGIRQHVVYVFTTPNSAAFTLNANATYEHLAIYPQSMTPTDVAALYSAQNGGVAITVNDTSTITVTERSPATDIYAYAWQIQSG